tara:strand:- start:3149 stop:3469 length:321 start_codon:yes stop_codon:yes gene_type:complete
MIKTLIQRATGTTPQTNGTSASDDWREGCGYNHFFEHEIVWDQGHYTGLDEEWGSVGIPYNILLDINSNAKGKYGWHFDVIRDTKYAKISFENEDDALWFRLKIKR